MSDSQPAQAPTARKFHLSLNVSDLPKSVAFYRVLFGREPAKFHADYAKFDLESPPAVISLTPGRAGGAGPLNHVGLCLLTADELVEIQRRLEEAGHKTLREDGVACCYSRQTKFWVRDPDGVLLELYILHEDLDEHGDGHAPTHELPHLMGGAAEETSAPASWNHNLGQEIALPLREDSNSVREIVLEGSLNMAPRRLDLPALLGECLRLLKPGGTVTLHGLAGDRPLLNPAPRLPGPAAAVEHVPDVPGLIATLREVGFRGASFTRLSEKGYFEAEGVPLREVLLRAAKPGFRSSKKDQAVIYLGPLRVVEDDHGNRFEKGVPTLVNTHDWQSLRKGPDAARFALLDNKVEDIACATTCPEQHVAKARYIMIGGFLGAGKTTAVAKLARHLTDQGLRVGLITNDQAGGLVDTRLLRGQGFATEEIAGGCFCCRFNTLMEAADKLRDTAKPDVFIAEPVGSCTDLVATVTYPLRRMYGDSFTIAPLSVLVDPVRARRVLGLDPGGTFSAKVAYIYRKQLEEADLLIIGKSDLIPEPQREELRAALAREFPQARILAASPRQETGLHEWFASLLNGEQSNRNPMTLDYDTYAEGEALLGWLNATVGLTGSHEFDANSFLTDLAEHVRAKLRGQDIEIAHFKMTFSPDDGIAGEIASVNLVRSDYVPELGMQLDEPSTGGQLILNLRAEGEPDDLMAAVRSGLQDISAGFTGLRAEVHHEEHFRPGKPTPTYRDGKVQLATAGGCAPGSKCC